MNGIQRMKVAKNEESRIRNRFKGKKGHTEWRWRASDVGDRLLLFLHVSGKCVALSPKEALALAKSIMRAFEEEE